MHTFLVLGDYQLHSVCWNPQASTHKRDVYFQLSTGAPRLADAIKASLEQLENHETASRERLDKTQIYRCYSERSTLLENYSGRIAEPNFKWNTEEFPLSAKATPRLALKSPNRIKPNSGYPQFTSKLLSSLIDGQLIRWPKDLFEVRSEFHKAMIEEIVASELNKIPGGSVYTPNDTWLEKLADLIGNKDNLLDRNKLHKDLISARQSKSFSNFATQIIQELRKLSENALLNEPLRKVPDVVVFSDVWPEQIRQETSLRSLDCSTQADKDAQSKADQEIIVKAWVKEFSARLESKLQDHLTKKTTQAKQTLPKAKQNVSELELTNAAQNLSTLTAVVLGKKEDDVQKLILEESDPESKIYAACVRQTLRRLEFAASTSRENRFPAASPILICCIDSNDIPNLDQSKHTGLSYLNCIYNSKWLRERTLIVFDADRLRKLDAPAGINSGSSWEKTAMDTVDAFQIRENLRPYLDFGFIVVRFGVTGALLITKQPGGEIAVRLFFDKYKTDKSWTDDSGIVLGYTEILVARIVQAITSFCNQRTTNGKSNMVHSDICYAIHNGIRLGLIACQSACHQGIPTDYSELELFANSNGISPDWFATTKGDVSSVSPNVDVPADWISSSLVPHVLDPRWSIVEESCFTNIAEIAFDIAKGGVDKVLNRGFHTQDTLVLAATLNISGIIENWKTTCSKDELLDEVRKKLGRIIQDQQDRFAPRTFFGGSEKAAQAKVDTVVNNALQDKSVRELAEEIAEFINNGDRKKIVEKTQDMLNRVRDYLSREQAFEFAHEEAITYYSAPIVRFGKGDRRITVIDRREVEEISAIQRLIQRYIHTSKTNNRPLSIAVFGPPGSGKSTAVKSIADAHDADIFYEKLEFNLSQLTTVEDLRNAFRKINSSRREQSNEGKLPLVFFDEFDCKFGQTPDAEFGWLKYFLAPMEDGTFGDEIVGPAIFVFAGGTSNSFNAFCPKTNLPTDERWIRFSLAKGPDWVSRLSGHLNIIGIDPTDSDDSLYLIRRAILIREFLRRNGSIDKNDVAMVDDPKLLHAILHAPSYRYGGRSLRMLISACTGDDNWIRRSNIPAVHELDMMVDSKSFFATLRTEDKPNGARGSHN